MSRKGMVRKIGFYTRGDCFGGLEKNALRFITWLTDDRNEVILFTEQNSKIGQAAKNKNIPLCPIERTEGYIDLKRAVKLSKSLKDNHIQLLVIIRPKDIMLAALIKTFLHRKLSIVYFQQSYLKLRKHPSLYSLLFRPFDAWITPSESIAKQMLSQSRYNPARMLVVPPCIDATHFSSDTLSRKAARKLLDLPAEKIILGAQGRLDPKKKLDFFIRTTQFLNRNNYDIDLLIMVHSGNDEEKEYLEFLEDLSFECGIPSRVHFRPRNQKLVSFFSAIDAFVTNTIPMPYDLIIHKAMASGVAVIAPFSDINSELLDNGNYGMLYRPNDLEDFSAKIIHLITQPKLKQHLRKAGQKKILEDVDRHAGCARINKLFDTLLE